VKPQVTFSQCGIVVNSNGKTISLDPKSHNNCDLTFVSHAHTDHLYKNTLKDRSRTKTLISKATSLIAEARGYRITNVTEEHEGFRMVDNGHILGSKGLLIGDELYYTGDICIRERAFMKPAFIPSAHTLIIESTFGRAEYVFPDMEEVIHKTNRIISDMYDLGVPVILMGYPLGKAQLLTALFGHWDPMFVYDSIHKINSLYINLGIPLKSTMKYSLAEKRGLLKKNKPWVMIAPLSSARSSFVKLLKRTYGAITIGFSGWAVNSRYKLMMDLDYSMPMSDHCDYHELIKVVRECDAKKIFTFHGFSVDFASSLRKMGLDAEALVLTNKSAKPKMTLSSSLDFYIKS
jgi:putative mRNA 3-end processing factor